MTGGQVQPFGVRSTIIGQAGRRIVARGARAADWILTGRSVSGREAAEAGFAAVSVAADRLGAEVDRLAERMLGTSPSALSAVLPLLRRARRAALTHPLADAENAYRALAGNEDLARAVREFGAGRGRGR